MPPALPETPRLRLRELQEGDAAFLVELLNDPDFLRYIGDRGVRDRESALAYLANGPRASYARHGFGLWAVEHKPDGAVAGLCGLLQRDHLPAPDLGYAFLPAWRGRGVASEACVATLEFARRGLGMADVLAIVNEDNAGSRRVLEKLGFRLQGPLEGSPGTLLYRHVATPGSDSGS